MSVHWMAKHGYEYICVYLNEFARPSGLAGLVQGRCSLCGLFQGSCPLRRALVAALSELACSSMADRCAVVSLSWLA